LTTADWQPRSRSATPPVEYDEPPTKRWWPLLAPLAVVVLLSTLVFSAGRHEWALSLFRQPTPYTALSLNKAWDLPSTYALGQAIPISFTISNQEGRTISYRYVVSESAGGTSETMSQSSRKVAVGASSTISTVVRPTCIRSPCRIQISLPGHPEIVDFLINLKA